jgi:hypothetical protein
MKGKTMHQLCIFTVVRRNERKRGDEMKGKKIIFDIGNSVTR